MSPTPGGGRVLAVATGTAVSRATGLLRVLVLAYVLGFSPLADAFNLANTVPNMLYDLVLGGVASATFIPVFVEQLALEGERRAWRSISSVVSAATLVLLAASIAAWGLAPFIIDAFTALGHTGATTAAHERAVATTLLRWFVPQVFCYGLLSLGAALLSVRHRFSAPAWAPVANNFVCIGALVWFHLVDPTPTIATVGHSGDLAGLALVTTLGVAVQAICLVPSMLRARLGGLRWHLDWHDPALRRVANLGSWTLGLVLANQASLYVVLAYAYALGGNGPISAYTYGWAFMQMPYAVVVVSVLSVLTPQLAAHAAANERRELGRRLAVGLRQSLVVIVPVATALIVLAQPTVAVLLNHANGRHSLLAGTALAVLAAGLPGFTAFQVAIRGLQSLQRARDAFVLYLFQNGLAIALCALMGRTMAGLTAAVSISYSAAALAALAALDLRGVRVWRGLIAPPVRRAVLAALCSAVAMAVLYNLPTATHGAALVLRLLLAAGGGLLVYGGLLAVSHRRSERPRLRAT